MWKKYKYLYTVQTSSDLKIERIELKPQANEQKRYKFQNEINKKTIQYG